MTLSLFFVLKHHDKLKYIIPSFFTLSLFIGLINTLKIPINDLAVYIEIFNEAENTPFIEYIFSLKKEPFFMVLTFLLYHITVGNQHAYLILITALSYNFIFLSIWKVHKYLKMNNHALMIAIVSASFFPNLLLLSGHLVRQFLANSILLFIVIDLLIHKRKNIVLFISSVLIHSTSFFGILLYLPVKFKVDNIFKVIKVVTIIVLTFLTAYNFSFILSIWFSNIPVLSYVSSRLANAGNSWETEPLGVTSILLLTINLTISLLFLIKNRQHRTFMNSIIGINVILFGFVIASYNFTEIALRFSMMSYFVFPFTIYFLVSLFKCNRENIVLVSISSILLFFGWTTYKLFYGEWTYVQMNRLIFLFS